MAPSDRERFVMLISAMAATFRIEPDAALFEGYWMSLDDMPIDDVEAAVKRAMRECDRFPAARQLRDLGGVKTASENALIAWGAVDRATSEVGGYKSVDFDDPITNATIRSMGGWEHFCTATVENFDTWLRKEFLRTYELLAKSGVGDEQGAPLVGLHAKVNALNGERIKEPLCITTGVPKIAGQIAGRLDTAPKRLQGASALRLKSSAD